MAGVVVSVVCFELASAHKSLSVTTFFKRNDLLIMPTSALARNMPYACLNH